MISNPMIGKKSEDISDLEAWVQKHASWNATIPMSGGSVTREITLDDSRHDEMFLVFGQAIATATSLPTPGNGGNVLIGSASYAFLWPYGGASQTIQIQGLTQTGDITISYSDGNIVFTTGGDADSSTYDYTIYQIKSSAIIGNVQ